MCAIVASIVVLVCLALTVCCCGWLLFAFVRCRRTYRRLVWLEVLQCYASYHVFNKPHELDGKTRTRTHVVWEYDESRLDAFRAHDDTPASQEDVPSSRDKSAASSEVRESRARRNSRTVDPDLSADGPTVCIDVESSSSESHDSWTPAKAPPDARPASGRRYRWVSKSVAPSGSASSNDTTEPLPSWAEAAYEDASIVEYYSCHNDQWLLAVVSLAALHEEPLRRDSFVAVVYNVKIGRTGQERTDVDLRFLRRPLEPHDVVEVRALPSGVWQAAQISKATQSNLGRSYRVTHDGTDGASLIVPGTSIRRRYVHGSDVRVYRGPRDGWVLGVVQDASSSDQRDCPNTAVPSMPVVRVTRNCAVEKRLGAPSATTAHFNVDERNVSVCVAGQCERVPAHLLDSSEGGKRQTSNDV